MFGLLTACIIATYCFLISGGSNVEVAQYVLSFLWKWHIVWTILTPIIAIPSVIIMFIVLANKSKSELAGKFLGLAIFSLLVRFPICQVLYLSSVALAIKAVTDAGTDIFKMSIAITIYIMAMYIGTRKIKYDIE